jgi:hypothetical protein
MMITAGAIRSLIERLMPMAAAPMPPMSTTTGDMGQLADTVKMMVVARTAGGRMLPFAATNAPGPLRM